MYGIKKNKTCRCENLVAGMTGISEGGREERSKVKEGAGYREAPASKIEVDFKFCLHFQTKKPTARPLIFAWNFAREENIAQT